MLFRVSGKFANGHTFSVNPIDGEDAKAALASVIGAEEISGYGHSIVSVTVKALSGKNKKVRISTEPAKERKGGGKKKTSAPAAPAPTPRKR